MREINASIPFDKRLWREDIAGSKAHVTMLAAKGVVSAEDAAAIRDGLDAIAAAHARDGVPVDLTLVANPMVTQPRTAEKIAGGPGRLPPPRARNHQRATDN